ncbi:LCP family protein [Candidatus Uhrbacteria bacterium]|nr:LCP family protein [Candidatus Uhrbacteria bacterium]
MDPVSSPNLLNDPTSEPPPRARRVVRMLLRAAGTTGIVLVVLFAVLAWTTRSSHPNFLLALRDSATVQSVLSLLRSPSVTLQGEREDRINVLLVGIGGAGHDGPLLADTILVASIQPSANRATLISIPRDLLLPLPDGRTQKANAVHAFAEDSRGDGANALRSSLSTVLGMDIPYYIRVDFAGFAGLVDALDGVDVAVERTLDDALYPITGKENAPWAERFEHLVIPAGRRHMDGAIALKYVRSRHALGVEGSDFARARRQQRLLIAVRERIRNEGLLRNPRALLTLTEAWRSHLATNLAPPELYRLAAFGQLLHEESMHRVVFTDGPTGELVGGIERGAYVLRPRGGSYEVLRTTVTREFVRATEGATRDAPAFAVTIWNGTTIGGLAARTATRIARPTLTITDVRNAPVRTLERSIIYHRTTVPDPLIIDLQRLLNADASTAFPALSATESSAPDILIVLGNSTASSLTVRDRPDPRDG